MRPRIFIGSSLEALHVAEEIQAKLSNFANVSVWTDDVFRLSEYACESLFRQLDRTDYAIFVLAADDVISVRNKKGMVPRDNVLFELGLFSGRLGLKKTFIVHPRVESLRLPTDLLGVMTARYTVAPGENLSAALGPVCTRIKGAIGDQPRDQIMSWQEYVGLVNILITQLKRTSGRGGFSFDTCVGVSRGGIIAADLIARHYGMNIPVICLWADLHLNHPSTCFAPPDNWINSHIGAILSDSRVRNILLVDDVSRSGKTIDLAKNFLATRVPNKNIRAAVLIADERRFDHVDFVGGKYDTAGLQLPYYYLG